MSCACCENFLLSRAHRHVAQLYTAPSNASSPCPPTKFMLNSILQHFHPQHCRCGGLPQSSVADAACPRHSPVQWDVPHVEDGADGAGALLRRWDPRIAAAISRGWGADGSRSFYDEEPTVHMRARLLHRDPPPSQ
eukprot:7376579-Prymnesium_polylepis.2